MYDHTGRKISPEEQAANVRAAVIEQEARQAAAAAIAPFYEEARQHKERANRARQAARRWAKLGNRAKVEEAAERADLARQQVLAATRQAANAAAAAYLARGGRQEAAQLDKARQEARQLDRLLKSANAAAHDSAELARQAREAADLAHLEKLSAEARQTPRGLHARPDASKAHNDAALVAYNAEQAALTITRAAVAGRVRDAAIKVQAARNAGATSAALLQLYADLSNEAAAAADLYMATQEAAAAAVAVLHDLAKEEEQTR